jgi:preprotein translocase subunit YajC
MFPASLPLLLAQAPAGPGFGDLLVPGLGMIAIMYFLVFRPQARQQKEQQALLASLKKGDDVYTQSGILGKIFSVDDKLITLEVASGVKVRMLKTAVQGKVTVEGARPDAAAADAKKEEK